jgi:Domain of unknown function (DUF4129)
MHGGSRLLAALAACTVVVAVWVANSGFIHLWHGVRPVGLIVVPALRHAAPPHAPPPMHTGPLPTLLVYVLLTLTVLFVVALLVGSGYRIKRQRQVLRFSPDDEAGVDDQVVVVPDQLRRAARRQLALLEEGPPRNAIIACWLELEAAVVGCGFVRDPAETPTEFTARVLSTYGVDPRAIKTLARLYLEARFSEHPLTTLHRRAALAALRRLCDSLGHDVGHRVGAVGSGNRAT